MKSESDVTVNEEEAEREAEIADPFPVGSRKYIKVQLLMLAVTEEEDAINRIDASRFTCFSDEYPLIVIVWRQRFPSV